MTIESRVRWARLHHALLADQEALEWAMGYVTARLQPVEGGHVLWTGQVAGNGLGLPLGVTRGRRFSPRLVVWGAAGRDFDDATVVLPGCGLRLCLALDHLVAVAIQEMGP